MSRIKGKGTGLEKAMATALNKQGLSWEEHAHDLPGRPDFVFRHARVVVFVDGDFWHGWRFKEWRDKLSERWEAKIAETKRRDAKNNRSLKSMGWKVIRFWEHQVLKRPDQCAIKVLKVLSEESKTVL